MIQLKANIDFETRMFGTFSQLCWPRWWVEAMSDPGCILGCQRVEQPNLGQTALKYQIDGWSGLACLRFWLRSTDPTKSLWRVPTVRHTHLSGRYLGAQPASGCSRCSRCLTHQGHTTLALASKVYITQKYIIPKQNGKWHWHRSQNLKCQFSSVPQPLNTELCSLFLLILCFTV